MDHTNNNHTAGVGGTLEAAEQSAVLLGLVKLAGPSGATTSGLKTGCLAIRNQEPMLEQMEADGLVTSEPSAFKFQGKVWRSVNVA